MEIPSVNKLSAKGAVKSVSFKTKIIEDKKI
jgi:hypothetical protein